MITRILILPFIFAILLIFYIKTALVKTFMFLVYGGEVLEYQKGDKKTILDVYRLLEKLQKHLESIGNVQSNQQNFSDINCNSLEQLKSSKDVDHNSNDSFVEIEDIDEISLDFLANKHLEIDLSTDEELFIKIQQMFFDLDIGWLITKKQILTIEDEQIIYIKCRKNDDKTYSLTYSSEKKYLDTKPISFDIFSKIHRHLTKNI